MTDWIKLGTGMALILPMGVSLFLIAWREAKQDGMPFSGFAKLAIAFAAGVLLILVFPIMAGMGVFMIYEAFR